MAINRFSSSFKERTDVIGQITPHNVVQRDISAPAGEWKPAAWLPIQFTKSEIGPGEDAFVISSGKVVALDSEGRVVPAGLRSKLDGAACLSYTATDVTYGVIDLTTGLAVTGAVSYSSLQLGLALLNRGLVLEEDAIAATLTVPPTTNDEGHDIVELFISQPIGIAPYDIYVWSGRPEDGDQVFTNYSKQHLVQFLTELQMKVPQFVAGTQADDTFDPATLDGAGSQTYVSGAPVEGGEFWDATNISQFTRWSSELTAASPVVALGLDPLDTGVNRRIARNTSRTPFACATSGVLVRERTSAGDISQDGDWYLDANVGVLFLHSDTWATMVAAATTYDFSYSFYNQAATSGGQQIHFDGPCVPGNFVTIDTESNFRVATAAEVAAGLQIVGRVLEVQVQPKGLLEHVKTAWNFNGVSTSAQTPGSATAGFTDLITLSPETVADQVVILNIRI